LEEQALVLMQAPEAPELAVQVAGLVEEGAGAEDAVSGDW